MATPSDNGFIENHIYDEIRIGQSARLVRVLTLADIQAFAAVSGDMNPSHLDDAFAQAAGQHTVVAHGMWSGSLVSGLLGNQFPGAGTVYLDQALGAGTDHAWGSHQFVVGGAVQGGRMYGQFPTLVVGGPDDTSGGKWIPTTSVDQYAATMTAWFGVSGADLAAIFPKLSRFATPNLGFLAWTCDPATGLAPVLRGNRR